ncbi:MAG: energy-coupling factor transporter transmembrane protein EcfT, partial [Clostridia bacterium]|nr:energy-coupling factor transporter transmembrane protein EcfT [Clostridia bacterium]
LFFAKSFWSLLFAAVCIFSTIFISRVPLRLYLKNLKVILPILAFTAILNAVYTVSGTELFSFWVIHITTGGLYRAFFMAFRILLLILFSSVLTYTTTPNALTDGIEQLLGFLKIFGLKNAVHSLAMMMTIAPRFIPTLVEEAEKIMNAQKARGADLESGNLIERIRSLVPILIPLLISSVRRAYELAEAMECRCYHGGEGRRRMKQLRFSSIDLLAGIGCIIFCAGILALNYVK